MIMAGPGRPPNAFWCNICGFVLLLNAHLFRLAAFGQKKNWIGEMVQFSPASNTGTELSVVAVEVPQSMVLLDDGI